MRQLPVGGTKIETKRLHARSGSMSARVPAALLLAFTLAVCIAERAVADDRFVRVFS